jgi:hypothetical protein
MKKLLILVSILALVTLLAPATLVFAATPDGAAGPWADSVVSYTQGLRKDGSPVLAARSNPNAALGVAENNTVEGNFFSLGFGGWIILGFDNWIINGTGNDIQIVEATNETYPAELIDVYVSQDGSSWVQIADNVNKDVSVDMGSMTWARYVKIVDQTDPSVHSSNADAYDLDGVKAIHSVESFSITASPDEALNPVGAQHTITATITPAIEGIPVEFSVTGANTASGTVPTDSSGEAQFSYTGNNSGVDTITVWIDQDLNATFDDTIDSWYEVSKTWWVENFVTGGGNIKGSKTTTWTFAGNVGYLPDGTIVGQFQIVDHASKVSWHCHNAFTSLVFSGDPIVGPPGPSASHSIATFTGTFTSNKGGTATLTVVITDVYEPGKDNDTIVVSGTFGFSGNPISGGNFQVHDIEAGGVVE